MYFHDVQFRPKARFQPARCHFSDHTKGANSQHIGKAMEAGYLRCGVFLYIISSTQAQVWCCSNCFLIETKKGSGSLFSTSSVFEHIWVLGLENKNSEFVSKILRNKTSYNYFFVHWLYARTRTNRVSRAIPQKYWVWSCNLSRYCKYSLNDKNHLSMPAARCYARNLSQRESVNPNFILVD